MTSKENRRAYWQSYYQKNRPKILERVRARRNANREEFRKQQREYRARNKDKFLARERDYYHKNAPEILERKRESQRYRARVYYWRRKMKADPTVVNTLKYTEAIRDLGIYVRSKRMAKELYRGTNAIGFNGKPVAPDSPGIKHTWDLDNGR